jgi:putative flippase GtrA
VIDPKRIWADHRELVTWVLMGGTNTLVTWLAYLAFDRLWSYEISYSLSYALGIVLAYYMNARWVFRVPMSWRTFLQFPLVYVVQYVSGLGLMYVLIELLLCPEAAAPLAVTAITLPITFVMSKLILKKEPNA